MLKYKLNINTVSDEIKEVQYESLYLSKDGSYITGVTNPSYCLSQKDTITVSSDEKTLCKLEAKDVVRGGYVIYNKSYKIEHHDGKIGILYVDGLYYCSDDTIESGTTSFTNSLGETTISLIVPSITIDNINYKLGYITKDENGNDKVVFYNEIIIPTKYWSYDNKITIDEIEYDVIIDNKVKFINDNEYYPYIILNNYNISDNDRLLYIIDWEASKQKEVTIFKISSPNKTFLNVKEAGCVDRLAYLHAKLVDGTVIRHYLDDYDNEEDFWNEITERNQQIKYETKRVYKSNIIELNVSNIVQNIPYNSIIYVRPLSTSDLVLVGEEINNEIIFTYYGRKYICNQNNVKYFVIIENTEYEIHKYSSNDDITYFIVFNDIPSIIQWDGESTTAKIGEIEEDFNVIKYNFVEIDGKTYNVIYNGNSYNVTVNEMKPFELFVRYFIGGNVIQCSPVWNDDLSDLFVSISNNPNNFIFEYTSQVFDVTFVEFLTTETRDYLTNEIKLETSTTSISLPIQLNSDNCLNLHKDDIIKSSLLDEIKTNSINRIVDMEKDIYYPVRHEKRGNKDIFTLCNEIQIDLHFRTRNLDTFIINDVSQMTGYNRIYSDNWNIFDYYRYKNDNDSKNSLKPILNLNSNDLNFFPPSDLLYFLNFTNEDVYYQKQKIGKSFLRLLFYDSPDPHTQSLLYTSTIFMSETELYKKFTNSDKNNQKYITIKERGDFKEGKNNKITYVCDSNNIAKNIAVHTEPINENNSLTFNESQRLSSSFVIKNRDEAIDSSDGFYLYLFKEYSNWLHERSIYLKVQFNHAGLGKTINFMTLFRKNNDGNKQMIDWSSYYNFNKFKDGCSLNDLYDHTYIEIKVKYDLQNKRFCYYLPDWMSEKNTKNKNVMRLSLFEIKIKDESNT